MEKRLNNTKVLVIGHNPFSEEGNNGRTMSEFFQDWDKKNLAQLFLRKETPSFRVCNNFFCVNDFDMVQSLKSRKDFGHIITEDIICKASEKEIKIYGKGSRKAQISIFGRNLLWKIGRWKSAALFQWIEDFNPNVIFYFAGQYIFSHKIVLYLSEKYKIPVVTFFGDDYYFSWNVNSPLALYNRRIYRKSFLRLLQSGNYITASPLMQKDYYKFFGTKGICILTPSKLKKQNEILNPSNDVFRISYLGGLGFKRYQALIEVAEALRQLPFKTEFNVYSNESREWLTKELEKTEGVCYRGGVSYQKVLEIMHHSNLLLHVESFDKHTMKGVKYSMSTKIADSLSCGVPFLGYGSEKVSCMNYLKSNGVTVAENAEQLKYLISKFYFDDTFRRNMVENQLEVARKNHNTDTNSLILKKLILETIENESITD